MKKILSWFLPSIGALWVVSHLYLYCAYDGTSAAYSNERLKNQMKETVASIGRAEEVLNKPVLFISAPKDLTFNAENVFITAIPNQKFFIITTLTSTNQVWPKPEVIVSNWQKSLTEVPTNLIYRSTW